MKTMDRRIAERRHGVTEQRAARRLRLLIGVVAIAVFVAAGFWVVHSPVLDVDRITVSGGSRSDPGATLDRLGIAAGIPTMSVDAAAIENALSADPWIEDATVVVTWPGTVEVEVTEHAPVAAVQAADGFAHVTLSGVVVEMLGEGHGQAVIVVPEPQPVRPGDVVAQSGVLGALEFVAGLPAEFRSGTTVYVDRADHLSATVGEYQIRLGRAIDMGRKSSAAVALIEYGIEAGSVVDVTAPRRPAVANPQPEVEDEG